MPAEKANPVASRAQRKTHGLAGNFCFILLPGLRMKDWRMNRAGARWHAGALFRDGREAGSLAAELLHAHHAAMLAVPAAAWGEIRVSARAKSGRDQHQAEDHRQRKCDRAAHGLKSIIACACRAADSRTDLKVECEHAPVNPASDLGPCCVWHPGRRLKSGCL